MLKETGGRYRRHLLESVVPFWEAHSLDREHGGSFTCLDRDGSLYDDKKYIWLQGRAAWMYSRLYNQVERRPEWLEAARGHVEFLRRHGRDARGRFYFSLTRDGRPFFYQRKPSASAFAMLGLLEYANTGAGREYLEEAIALYWDILAWMRDPVLLDRPAMAGRPRTSRLGYIMTTASLTLELAAVHEDPRYEQVLRECLERALLHLDPARNVLMEEVALDGSPFRNQPEGRLLNPGHSVEVAWFLLHILERLPDPAYQAKMLDVIRGTLEFSWDREYGGIYYFMDVDGKPPLQLEHSMKLWWPHTEALYALVLAYDLTRDAEWLEWLERVDRYAFSHFADGLHGEWFGYCDRQGNLTHTLKGNNYKGFFHVPRALLMCAQRIERSGL